MPTSTLCANSGPHRNAWTRRGRSISQPAGI